MRNKKSNKIIAGIKPKRIVILLAAGFSHNRGYPLGYQLNERIKKLDKIEFSQIFRELNLQNVYYFLIDIINHYSSAIGESDFNYEDLYDGIDLNFNVNRKFCVLSEEYRKLSEPYRTEFFTFRQLVYQLPFVLNWIIMNLITEDGKRDILENGHSEINFSYYKNFIHFLQIESNKSLIEIFTLNHDLFIDTFKKVKGLEDKICDGFDDCNSTYYGSVFGEEGESRCKLERYTARYYKPVRIYKLHGSFDYFPFYRKIETGGIPFAVPYRYVKLKGGVHPLYLSKLNRRTQEYDDSLSPSVNPDFLSGTEIKKVKYNNPNLYARLFKKFKKKLIQVNQVIIIGYGAKDDRINEYLCEYINCSNVTIFDYSPKDSVYELQKKLKADIITGEFDEKILSILNE